jgi:hypothetical protein
MHARDTITTTGAADTMPPLAVTFATGQRISGLGLTTLWRLAREHQIETVRIGRRTLITYRSLARLLLPDSTRMRQSPSRGRSPKPASISP